MTAHAGGGRPAALLDRDGVLNVRLPGDTYVTRPEELELLPHAPDLARALHERGYLLVVVTNQRGVARGFMDAAALAAVHDKLGRELATAGAPLAGVYACPHDRDAGCRCRKPLPGLIEQAAAELGLDLARSVLIGDSERDVAAGHAAGVGLNLLVPSNGDPRFVLERIPAR